MVNNKEVAIIGLGPAGVSASIYLKRYGMEPVCYEKDLVGGKTNYTDKIVNYPGYVKEKGPLLAEDFLKQLESFSIKPIYRAVSSVELTESGTFLLSINQEKREFKYVILAMGLSMKKSSIKNIDKFLGRGVSSCAVCDGNFYKGKNVSVFGNGNAALEETYYLSTLAKKIDLIVPDEKLLGMEMEIERIKKTENINIYYSSFIKEIIGENKVEKLVLKSRGEQKEIEADGLFIYGNMLPSSSILAFEVKNDNSYILVDEKMETSVKNLYAIGDYRKTYLRQVATAISDGAVASYFIHNSYLADKNNG